jgi:hypothetical protein
LFAYLPHQNQQINHGGFTYGKKNFNLTNYQMDCKQKHSFECPVQMCFSAINGKIVDMSKAWTCGEHSHKCLIKNGVDTSILVIKSGVDASILDVHVNDDEDKKPAAVDKKSYTNI